MAKIRSKGTVPEMVLHGHLKGQKWQHRMWPDIEGNPDVLIDGHIAVFVNGCFWHGCNKHFKCPKTNRSFWSSKIFRNKIRQSTVRARLRRLGYKTVVVWEHELSASSVTAAVDRIRRMLS